MSIRVQAGQVWSMTNSFRVRYMIRIGKVAVVDGELRADATTINVRTPKAITVRVSTLLQGSRSAKLLTESDGSVHVPPAAPVVVPKTERELTASDYRRELKPKGRAHVSEKMIAVHKMCREGIPSKEVAAHFGVTRNAVFNWCSRVEEAIADARFLGEQT